MSANRSLRVLIGTVGGQGGGVLIDWLIRGLLNAGWDASSIGLLGMSQRAGTVTYYGEAFPPGLGSNVRSMFAVPGDVNLIIGQELLELGRLLAAGYPGPDCVIVGNSARTYSTLEKMPAENGVYDSDAIIAAAVRLAPGRHYLSDAQGCVVREGLSPLSSNAFLLGLAIGSDAIALSPEPFLKAIEASGVSVRDNKAAFLLGYARVKMGVMVEKPPGMEAPAQDMTNRLNAQGREALAEINSVRIAKLPEPVRAVAYQGAALLIDYQDKPYADAYLDTIEQVMQSPGVSSETATAFARQSALWWAYEDISHVAFLKSRPERFSRLLGAHQIKHGQRMVVMDYLAPDAEQLLGLLPETLAGWVESLGNRLFRDFSKKSWRLRLNSSSVYGYWLLRLLATSRNWRRYSRRYHDEMAHFHRWQKAVLHWSQISPSLGLLAAEAGRVLKGYGRVRRMAVDDLFGFIDEGLPLLSSAGLPDADCLRIGRDALIFLASEAGMCKRSLETLQSAVSKQAGKQAA